ncbi:hypothetical protein RHGRI_033504 [Rhododendron griersonianum]|uniref:Uncharacterized protein n=1 Tax=Rhododendron griersonianum TaxID=479676 RepID=A0AAV6I1A2_9ERIC|nr:hypothetical protein RHGRI_033504 [Rhododendron griersonianum]
MTFSKLAPLFTQLNYCSVLVFRWKAASSKDHLEQLHINFSECICCFFIVVIFYFSLKG